MGYLNVIFNKRDQDFTLSLSGDLDVKKMLIIISEDIKQYNVDKHSWLQFSQILFIPSLKINLSRSYLSVINNLIASVFSPFVRVL
jgi:hypothetical protein